MIDIVLRCRNDVALLPATLAGVRAQPLPHRLVAFDNGSDDGSRELLAESADVLIDVPAGAYVPGRVLNQAMRETSSPLVVFLNSDCEPLDDRWLAALVAPMDDPPVAAAFGRQLPRPGCVPWFARDTEDTFGDGVKQARWRHCFSMASSVVRRTVWETRPFSESIQYSEDIEWTWWARQAGHRIAYAPESRVYHSHNYSAEQFFRRQYGEGKADAAIFDWDAVSRSWVRYSLFPFLRQVAGDIRYCARTGSPLAALGSPRIRLAAMRGRRQGFRAGLR